MTKSERNKAIETRDARIEILGQGIEAHLGKIKAYIERNESDWEMWDKKWEAVRERRETVGWKLRPSDEQDDGEGSRCGEDKREG